ncbi:hypothetical protein TrST_g10125 [Triparma strigata]|uniref:Midasin n=1 Tax=Triparma strigata TaxID=1606541 RepID=A0A9W7A9I3_9STRA|nr:hypothetical protein TrST_g10125 [Triparma strigata]
MPSSSSPTFSSVERLILSPFDSASDTTGCSSSVPTSVPKSVPFTVPLNDLTEAEQTELIQHITSAIVTHVGAFIENEASQQASEPDQVLRIQSLQSACSNVLSQCAPLNSSIFSSLLSSSPHVHFIVRGLTLQSSLKPMPTSTSLDWAQSYLLNLEDLFLANTATTTTTTTTTTTNKQQQPSHTPPNHALLALHSLHNLNLHYPQILEKTSLSLLLHTISHPQLKNITLKIVAQKRKASLSLQSFSPSTSIPPPGPPASPSLLTLPSLPPLPLPPNLTATPTFLSTLRTLTLTLLSPRPTILTGPHGSGKTTLLNLLATHLSLPTTTLNFDSTTDSKTLLGSYVCSEIPGEFTYQPGTLTRSCLTGGLLILEDLDTIPLEILSIIIPIIETRKLPSGEPCSDKLYCFATRLDDLETQNNRKGGGRRNELEGYFKEVHVEGWKKEDLEVIAKKKFNNIPSSITSRFTKFFYLSLTSSSSVSYIDWFKIMSRVSTHEWPSNSGAFVTDKSKFKVCKEIWDCMRYKCVDVGGGDKRFVGNLKDSFEVNLNDLYDKMNERIEINESATSITFGRATLPKGPTKEPTYTSSTEQSNFPTNVSNENYVETHQTLHLTSSISMSISLSEPLLLVGETGCGKTTLLQKLASRLNRTLTVQNLSLNTDGSDLLGGYKPVEIKHYVKPIYNAFVSIFTRTFSRSNNDKFLKYVKGSYEKCEWKKLSKCFVKAGKMGGEKFEGIRGKEAVEWEAFQRDALRFEKIRKSGETGMAFTFKEGALVKCIREGGWILLDEINLAGSSTLQRIFGLLDGVEGTLTIQERGDLKAIKRHPDFRIFAAMNPATDNGKKDLPKGMRSRFTEIYVDELKDELELRKVSSKYFRGLITKTSNEKDSYVNSTVRAYLQCKDKADSVLVDSQNKKPSYTLRTLCRALSATVRLLTYNKLPLKRSVYEGFMLAFAGGLEDSSKVIVEKIIKECVGGEIHKKELEQIPQKPNGGGDFVTVKPFWLPKGPLESVDWTESVSGVSKFVLTKTASTNLRCLSRSLAAGPWPILIEGPTSAGKTTLVEFLSAKTGHRCVRINNHEHTDVQEYTGCYVTNALGQLVFREGILVEALRKGWWIILDELNLAPSEVLEALNRLLDDNRELYISETQETVTPHPNFRLFATQNPSGAYGGRKPLSKAFRNRFVEVSMGDIPNDELATIMERRCGCPPSHAKLLVKVLNSLQLKRSKSDVFRGKAGLITPRDLLRWAERNASSKIELAFEGYCILAERLRTPEEKIVVKETIESVIKVEIDSEAFLKEKSEGRAQLAKIIGSEDESGLKATGLTTKEIAPTSTLLRLLLLVGKCIAKKEPVLLVGETGCGKTTVIQLYGLLFERKLHVVNCHANTETGDLLGGLRPLRGRGGKVEEMVGSVKDLVDLCGTQHNNWLQASNLVVPDMEVAADGQDVNEVEARAITFARDLYKYLKTLFEGSSGKADSVAPPEPPKRKRLDSDASSASPPPIDRATQKIIAETMDEIEAAHRRSNALFAWLDGPLVNAMREGHLILLDEMSLAEDAVLERLNSVLEPSRTLTLAEKGGAAGEEGIDEIVGHEDFRIFATMNPGGDFGKRELSPALRSRFTEIWVPQIKARVDFELVLNLVLGPKLSVDLLTPMLDYVDWFNAEICGQPNSQFVDFDLSLRDVLGWARFIVTCVANKSDLAKAYQCFLHGAGLMHLDGLGLGTGVSSEGSWALRSQSKAYLMSKVPEQHLQVAAIGFADDLPSSENQTNYISTKKEFGVLPFTISTGPVEIPEKLEFSMTAPTTCMNLRRVTRALQLSKPILLEGSPGVGKTSLIQALATASGHNLVRINLSEQTDIADLMGSDLPVAGEEGAKFKWFDGVFLKALKRGDWVLLDELNLASQSVLEGLNSCLDHRSEVFIPELCATFQCPASFRVFAAQNPLSQGGGRKGLPKSFLNRFTKVFVEALTGEDLINIVGHRYPGIRPETVTKMVQFNTRVQHDVVEVCKFGRVGFPWEFNLRDVFRWCSLAVSENAEDSVSDFVDAIYLQRMRTLKDREELCALYFEVFGKKLNLAEGIEFGVVGNTIQVGAARLKRVESVSPVSSLDFSLPVGLLRPLETVVRCVNLNWPCLIIGPKASGKTAIVSGLADAVGVEVVEWAMTPGTDVTELLGCFEQIDSEAEGRELIAGVKQLVEMLCFDLVDSGREEELKVLNGLWWSMSKKIELNEGVLDEGTVEMCLGVLEKAGGLEGDGGRKVLDIIAMAKKIKAGIGKGKAGSTFQWVDGVLVKAMQEGRWLSLNNVNFCPSSVLDRLNPLMEMGGELVLTEGGADEDGEEGARVIKPHPNFRLFLSMNSERGEVSRAMRNRCIEVALIGGFGDGEEEQKEIDLQDCLYRAGIRDALLAERMIEIHENEVKLEESHTSRMLVLMAEMWRDLAKSGLTAERALDESWRCVYGVINNSDDETGEEKKEGDRGEVIEGPIENGEGMFDVGDVGWFEDWRLARAQRDLRLALYLKKNWTDEEKLPSALVKLMGGQQTVTNWLKVGGEAIKKLCCDIAVAEFVRSSGEDSQNLQVRREFLAQCYDEEDADRIFNSYKEMSGIGLDRLEIMLSLGRVKDLAKSEEKGAMSRTKDLTPIELSYCIAAKSKKSDAAGGKKLLALLVDIFNAIDKFAGGDANLLRVRDEMWMYLNSFPSEVWIDGGEEFDGRFLVFWRWLVKAFRNFGGGGDGGDERLRRMFDKVDELLGRSGAFSSNLLWKKGGHPAGCMTCEGLVAKTKLIEVGARSVVGGSKKILELARLVEECHGLLFLDEGFKREVLMGMCTLQWEMTDEKGEGEGGNSTSVQIAEALAAKANKLAVDFKMELKRKTVDVNILTVENQQEAYDIVRGGGEAIAMGDDPSLALMERWGVVQSSVLIDRWSVAFEDKLLDELCQCTDLAGFKEMMKSGGVRDWIDLTLKGNRGIERCRGWQTLLWASESDYLNWTTVVRLRSVLLPTLLTFNGLDVWTGGFNSLDGVEVGISNPILWSFGGVGGGLEGDVGREERFENFGYSRFVHPVVTTQIARLFTNFGDVGGGQQRITLQNAAARGNQANNILQQGLRGVGKRVGGWGVVRKGIENILTVYAEADGGEVWPDGKTVLAQLVGQEGCEASLLLSCDDDKFKELVPDVLEPLVHFYNGGEDGKLGQALILLGLATVHLYAPTEPLDPGRKPAAKCANIEMRLQSMAARAEVKRWNARLNAGGGCEELEGWDVQQARAEKQRRKIVARPSSSYDRLFREMVQFVKSVGNVKTVLKLAAGEGGKDVNWIRSCVEFMKRVEGLYGGYEDVTHGILSGVVMIMKGLRLNSISRRGQGGAVEDTVGFMLELPWRSASVDLVEADLAREIGKGSGASSVAVLESQVAVLFGVIQRVEIDLRVGAGDRKASYSILRRCFSEIVNVWKIAESKREEEEEEGKVETEEEREERELREQFPDFSREFTRIVEKIERKDEMGSDSESDEEEEEEQITSSFRLTPEQIQKLCEVHARVFGGELTGVDDGLRRRVFKGCYEATARILPAVSTALSDVYLDEQVKLGNVLALTQTRSLCSGVELGKSKISGDDKFNTSNVGAALRAEGVLAKVVMRITVLLKAYPGHAVLLAIGGIAERLRGLDVRSPLAKVLCGMEVLLKKAQEWEQHASARVKLGDPLTELSKLVAEWRKLELESWSALLDSREAQFADKARKIWARLYSVLDGGGGSPIVQNAGVPNWLFKGARTVKLGARSGLSEKEEGEVREITKLLDSFILTAGVGELEVRLELLRNFAGELKTRAGAKFYTLSRILTSLVDYYQSFSRAITAHRESGKAAAEKKLKDEVRLAKWDDQNYYAQVESTVKNQKQLNKHLKLYDEVLNQPVSALIEQILIKGVREREGGIGGQERGATKLPSDGEIFGTLDVKGGGGGDETPRAVAYPLPIGAGVDKITRIASKHLAKFNDDKMCAAQAAERAAGISEAIFERITALRSEAATKVMKERGLVDLLKTLQSEGYGTGLWSTPPQIRDLNELLSLSHPNVEDVGDRFGRYFWKVVSEVKQLRNEVKQFGSRFIGGRECKLMVGMCEQILITTLQNRSLFAGGRVVTLNLEEFEDCILGGKELKARLEAVVLKNRHIREQLSQISLVISGLGLNDQMSHLRLVIGKCDRVESALGSFDARVSPISSKVRDEICAAESFYSSFESEFTTSLGKSEFLDLGLERIFKSAKLFSTTESASVKVEDDVEEVVKKLQIVVQQILGHFTALSKKEEEEEERTLIANHVKASELHELCAVQKFNSFIHSLVAAIDDAESEEELEKGRAAIHLLKVVSDFVADRVEQKTLKFGSEISKLGFVVVRVFRQLVAKGFCHEDEGEEGEGEGGGEGGEGKFSLDEGTGMGEGDTNEAEDVTDQIENEEQLLGLKGDEEKEEQEKKPNEQLDEKDVDTGMEMENDFEGDTFDMPDKKEDDQPQKDDGEEEELDREMGEGGGDDPNEEVVDEKLWDEEDKEENEGKEKEGEDKFEKDSKVEGGMAEDEMRTKEDDEEEDRGKGSEEGKDESKPDTKDKGEDDGGEDGPEGEDKEGGDEEGQDDKINDDLEDNYEENHNMEVQGLEEEDKGQLEEDDGDEMNLEDMKDLDEEGDGDGEENDGDLEVEEGKEEEDGMEDVGEEKMTGDDEPENDEEDEALESANIPTATDVEMNEEQGEEDNVDDKDEEEPTKLDVNADDDDNDAEHGVAAQSGNSKVQENEEEQEKEEGEDEEGGAGGEEDEEEKEPGKEGGDPDDGGDGEFTKGQGEEGGEEEKKDQDFPNPFDAERGDVKKKWHERLNLLENDGGEGEEEKEETNVNEEEEENPSGAFEMVEKGGAGGDTQVLGAVFDDKKMDIEKEDDDEGGEGGDVQPEEKLDEENDKEKEQEKDGPKKDKKTKKEKKEKRESEKETQKRTEDEGVADMDIEVEEERKEKPKEEEEGEGEGESEEEVERQTQTVTDLSRLQVNEEGEENEGQAEVDVQAFERTARDPAAAAKWASIYATTLPLARRLCEKLRLVMEPLLATKLQGDYKSGKRINMKKVIGYIASGYRRDKIWLRRTKPAKRDYKVLLAIDDSESMMKGGAGEQALQALAILANGMSQLEIGRLGVASFGEEMKMIHPFDQPFVADSGSKCVASFKFDQQRTKMAECVSGAMDVLNENGGESEGRRLCFLISDGRVERDNREFLKRLIRDMNASGILLVMIVIDGTGSQSILSMKEVNFVNGKPKVSQFIAEYPFPFYLLCNDVGTLPDVLGDSLRQWLEMLARLEGAR